MNNESINEKKKTEREREATGKYTTYNSQSDFQTHLYPYIRFAD